MTQQNAGDAVDAILAQWHRNGRTWTWRRWA